MENDEVLRAIEATATSEMHHIDHALERIDAGAFGICEQCEEEIGIERLKARPVTTLCIDCKSTQEFEEKKARRAV